MIKLFVCSALVTMEIYTFKKTRHSMFEVANLFETDCQTHLSFVQRVSFLKKYLFLAFKMTGENSIYLQKQ